MIRAVRVPTASAVSRAAKSCESFFPVLLYLRIALGMTSVRCHLAPPMARQKPVDDRGCHLPPQALRQRRPKRRQHQHSTRERLFCPRLQELLFLFFAHQRAPSSAPTLAATVVGVAPPPEPGLESRHGCSSNT